MVAFGRKWFYSGKSFCIRVKVVVFGQSGCNREKVVLFVQKWLFSGKSGSIRTKVVVLGQKWLSLATLLCSVKSGRNRARAVVF